MSDDEVADIWEEMSTCMARLTEEVKQQRAKNVMLSRVQMRALDVANNEPMPDETRARLIRALRGEAPR